MVIAVLCHLFQLLRAIGRAVRLHSSTNMGQRVGVSAFLGKLMTFRVDAYKFNSHLES
jgi:hypothetical protein